MESKKRKPGRPKGTGLNDDPYFLQMAKLMVDDPKLTKTKAFKLVKATWTYAEIRRIQTKWCEVGDRFLTKELEKRASETKMPASMNIALASQISKFGAIAAAAEQAHAIFNNPAQSAMREYLNSPAQLALRAHLDSSTMQAIRVIQSAPAMLAMQAMQRSTTYQAMMTGQALQTALHSKLG